jgi:transposase
MAKLTPAAVRGDKTLADLAQQQGAHPNQITDGMNLLLARTADVS